MSNRLLDRRWRDAFLLHLVDSMACVGAPSDLGGAVVRDVSSRDDRISPPADGLGRAGDVLGGRLCASYLTDLSPHRKIRPHGVYDAMMMIWSTVPQRPRSAFRRSRPGIQPHRPN